MVHPDLLRAGLIKDPFWGDQAKDCQWVEDWEWIYARDFGVPAGFPLDWAVLRFDGLDTYATIRVNGQEIGHWNDMFIPFEFEIGSKLKPGRNHIEVAFHTVASALAGKPYKAIHTLFDQTGERTYSREMACIFGWDWITVPANTSQVALTSQRVKSSAAPARTA
jgi:beta-mannosidase